jgi:hypothetical protein
MASVSRPPSPQERAALLQFETLYEQWRCASEALVAVEVELWDTLLRSPHSEDRLRLASETVRLRRLACAARERVLGALDDGSGLAAH